MTQGLMIGTNGEDWDETRKSKWKLAKRGQSLGLLSLRQSLDVMLLFRLIRYLTLSGFTFDVHAADGGRDKTVSCAIRFSPCLGRTASQKVEPWLRALALLIESVITDVNIGRGVRGLGFPFHHFTTKQNRPTTGTKVNEVRAAPLTFDRWKLNLISSCTNEEKQTTYT